MNVHRYINNYIIKAISSVGVSVEIHAIPILSIFYT